MLKSTIIRTINKLKFILGYPKRVDPNKIRKKEARRIGRKLHLKKNNYIFCCDSISAKFYLPRYETDYIQQLILTKREYYEKDNLDFICKKWENGKVGNEIKNGCILDIGTNIGNHTLYFFNEIGILKAICFEPIDFIFDILCENIKLNHLEEKVVLYNVAVGECKGLSSVKFYNKDNIGSTQIAINKNGNIPIISIDSLNIEDNIKFVKIDVESFETKVICGAINTIEKNKPYIMIEIQDENFDFIKSELEKLGYSYMNLGGINYFFFVV